MRKAKSVAVVMLIVAFAAVLAVPAAAQRSDIVTTVLSSPNYTTLVSLTQAAGLTDTLMGAGPYTVFAPTNMAFSRLPVGTINRLTMPENRELLRSILSYHVVSGRYMASDIISQTCPAFTVSSVSGPLLRVTHGRMGVTVNNALVIQPDIMATNGVIHGIDRVLIPPAMTMR